MGLDWFLISMADHNRAGIITIFFEIRTPTDQQKELIHRYASFMHSFVGRGVCESEWT